MENKLTQEEKIYLEIFWQEKQVNIEQPIRDEINNLILLSRTASIQENQEVQKAKTAGKKLFFSFKVSDKIKNWLNDFLIRYENLGDQELKEWLIAERNQILNNEVPHVDKSSFYHDILRLIKKVVNQKSEIKKTENIKEKLLDLFKEGEIEKCFTLLEEHQITSIELIQIQNQWNSISKLKRTGQISITPLPEENRIKNTLLELISQLK